MSLQAAPGLLRFERWDPEQPPATDLLAEMRDELNDLYETFDRLDHPALSPSELRPPAGAYLVGFEGAHAVAGGGVRQLAGGVGEIKRMFVRPAARSRGVAGSLLAALEEAALSLGYTRARARHGAEAGPRAPSVPPGGLRRGGALQRQPVRMLLGGEDPRVSTSPPDRVRPGFEVRHGWGVDGIASLGGDVAAIVVVDVLRFTTAVDVAAAAGAAVHPAPWPTEPAAGRVLIGGEPAEVADGKGPRRLSLSPPSLRRLRPGDRIVLPSANGSRSALAAAAYGVPVLAACLRNADAVAEWIRDSCEGGPVAVIACGEIRSDGTLRPAVEDQIGAGAVVGALPGLRSPESRVAAALYRRSTDNLFSVLAGSVSGRELREKGLAEDLEWAAAENASRCVPIIGEDGAFRGR